MEIAISKSKKPDKQLDDRIDNKKRLHLVRKGLQITQNIKIHNENNDMLTGIKKRKIGLNQV